MDVAIFRRRLYLSPILKTQEELYMKIQENDKIKNKKYKDFLKLNYSLQLNKIQIKIAGRSDGQFC